MRNNKESTINLAATAGQNDQALPTRTENPAALSENKPPAGEGSAAALCSGLSGASVAGYSSTDVMLWIVFGVMIIAAMHNLLSR